MSSPSVEPVTSVIKPIYQYEALLDSVYHDINPATAKRDINIVEPRVSRGGPKKSDFINFERVCECMNRDCAHVRQFLESELSATSSVNIDNVLIMNGKFTANHIRNVLVKYISTYVQCPSCQSDKTVLEREGKLRLIRCTECKSTKYI